MILLLLRQNTGYMDDYWTLPSGHIEEGEFPSEAVKRETKEETGLTILKSREVHHMYRRKPGEHHPYEDHYFIVENFLGDPFIPEDELGKCAELKWFPKKSLPEKMIPCVKKALAHITHGLAFSEVIEPT